MFSRLILLVALFAATSFASATELDIITDYFSCNPEDDVGESGWYTRTKDENVACLFAQFPRGKPENPYVRIQGKNITLERIAIRNIDSGHWEVEEIYANRPARLTVRLKSRLLHDSCKEVEEKCCGQEYEGLLEVSDPSGQKIYKVTRWSGA